MAHPSDGGAPAGDPAALRRFLVIALGIAGLAAVGLIAIVVAFGAPRMGTGDAAVCLEPYSPDTLANRMFAFDGTVTGIEGEDVTFHIEHAYIGVEADVLTLSAPGLMSGAPLPSSSGPPGATPSEAVLVAGQRYLVAGDDGVAWGCGFTRPYDAAGAAEWSSVFSVPSASAAPASTR